MLKHSRQRRGQRTETADWDAQFAIIDGSGPRRSARDVKESLFRVKRHQNIVARGRAQSSRQVVVVRLERRQDLSAECFRGLLAFIMQNEMAALALSEVSFGILLAFGFREILLNRRVGAQFQGMLPGSDRVLGTVGGLLRV